MILKAPIFAVFVGFSGTAAAQTAETMTSDGQVLAATNTEHTTEQSSFSLFQHGIWPRTSVSDGLAVRPSDTQLPGPVFKKGKPKGLNGKTAARRMTFLPSIRAAERRHRLPFGLLDALIWAESRYNPMALSHAGAAGLTQLMPGTASDLGVQNRYDPTANIDGGARYLRQMLDKFSLVHLALAAYNAGPNAVKRARGIPNNRETPSYVRSVLRRWQSSRS